MKRESSTSAAPPASALKMRPSRFVGPVGVGYATAVGARIGYGSGEVLTRCAAVLGSYTRIYTGMRERACGSRTDQNPLAEHAHTHTHKHHHRARTQPGHTIIPASCRSRTSRHSRCSAQTRASGLAGAERAKTHSRSTRNTPHNLAASRGEAAQRQG